MHNGIYVQQNDFFNKCRLPIYCLLDMITTVVTQTKGDLMGTNTIDHTTLTHLVEAGAVRGADVVGLGSGWGIIVKYGMTERALAARRGAVRTFRKFETLVSYLKDVGISKYNVDASNYDPTRSDAARRPDRSAALKRTHEEAAYNAWFREQVQSSIDDPRPAVSHEDAKAQFAERKAALRLAA